MADWVSGKVTKVEYWTDVLDFSAIAGFFQLFRQMLCYIFRTAQGAAADKCNVCHRSPIARSTVQSGVLYAVSELGSTCGKMWD